MGRLSHARCSVIDFDEATWSRGTHHVAVGTHASVRRRVVVFLPTHTSGTSVRAPAATPFYYEKAGVGWWEEQPLLAAINQRGQSAPEGGCSNSPHACRRTSSILLSLAQTPASRRAWWRFEGTFITLKGFSPSGPKSRMWLHGHFQAVSGGLWTILVRKRITAS